jgi:hypothetical protein
VAGATVEARQSGALVATTSTSATGAYSLALDQGTYDLVVLAPSAGAETTVLSGLVVSADQVVDIVMSPAPPPPPPPPVPTFTVTGRILSADGSIPATDPSLGGPDWMRTVVNVGGREAEVDWLTGEFTVTEVVGGASYVWISPHRVEGARVDSGWLFSTMGSSSFEVSGDMDLGTITLPVTHRLTVNVVDQDNDPWPNATVYAVTDPGSGVVRTEELLPGVLFSSGAGPMSSGSGETDAGGSITFTVYDHPNVRVVAWPGSPGSGQTFTATDVAADSDRTITVAVSLTPPPPPVPTFTVTGRVAMADGSVPPNSLGVALQVANAAVTYDQATGDFSAVGVEAGTRSFRIETGPTGTASGWTIHMGTVEVVADTDLGTMALPEYDNDVTVRVIRQDGTPVVGASVSLFGGGGAHTYAPGVVGTSSVLLSDATDADGDVTLTVPDGPNFALAASTGSQGISQQIGISGDRTIVVVIITAPRAIQITATNDTSALVEWQPPIDDSGVEGYQVDATPTGSQLVGVRGGSATVRAVSAAMGTVSVTVPASARAALLEGLLPGTTYEFSVRAITADGLGPAATVTEATTGGC